MAYVFKFLTGKKKVLRFPVPPGIMNISIKNQNKSISLINGKEINILASPGLKTIEFEALLPRVRYPFASYRDDVKKDKRTPGFLPGRLSAKHFLKELAKLKKSKKPFQFIIVRKAPTGKSLGDNNFKVSLEDYIIKEDAEEGLDVMVAITLKEYRPYGTKKCNNGKKGKPKENTRDSNQEKPKTIKWAKGDTLSKLAKKYLGESSRHTEIAKLNKITNPATIKVGQIIKMP